MLRRLVPVAIVFFSVIPLAACHAFLPGCVPRGGTSGTARVTVSIDPDWNPFNRGKFVPSSVTVRAGNRVTWTFRETTAPHSITADDGSFDSCQMVGVPGTVTHFTVMFSKTGTFKYHCRVHSGMRGEVKVT
ncbi:MAG TPA: plastocyanin/azurin family copper-binding protein [Candidatus Dormibacteraeota bacterium]